MFMKGTLCELRVLEGNDYETARFTTAVNAGLTTEHLFTGSIPMRAVDYKERWRKEREAGDILFGIWIPPVSENDHRGQCFEAGGGRDDHVLIGTCGLYSHREIYRSWEARWIIFDPDAVGKGIGKQAVTLLTDYAFYRLNAHKVWLGVSEHNLRAVKCYLDCAYKIDGLLRDAIFYQGRYHGTYQMSMTEEEWKATRAAKSTAP